MDKVKFTKKDIKLVYDYISPYYTVPNGVNYRYLYSYVENSFIEPYLVLPSISDKYDDGVSVFDGEKILQFLTSGTVSTNDIGKIEGSSILIYCISIHGSPNAAMGYKYSINENFPVTRFISKKALKAIREKENVFLLINYSTEGILVEGMLETIHIELDNLVIPHKKVIFATASHSLKTDYNQWHTETVPNSNKINVLTFNWAYPTKHLEYTKMLNSEKQGSKIKGYTLVTKDKLPQNERRYKFLMFNRRLRLQRLYPILYFYYKDIINDFLISYDFLDPECNPQGKLIDPAVELLSWEMNKEDIVNQYNHIVENIPNITIDYEDISEVRGMYYENYEPFIDSYINIVSETNFFRPGDYISEKALKPIANLQPFIIIGSSNSLAELRSLGFKTFHPFINEEYDSELDNNKRLELVLKEIYRLSQKSISEIDKWYRDIFHILEYNQNLLLDQAFSKEYLQRVYNDINKIYENSTKSSQ